MKRVLLKLSYDGTAYHGWQVQDNAVTVQSVLQDALFNTFGVRPDVTGCSRTDAGVHAEEFYCHIDIPENLPESAFTVGLNSNLPNDISVLSYSEVADDFHARYCAKGKTYRYGFYFGTKNPFLEKYFLHLDKPLDVELMNEFCKSIVGKHDFAPFSSIHRTVEDTFRTVSECFVYTEDNKIFLKITADGFLYNMVRIIAGTAYAVGMGRLKSNCAIQIFEQNNRTLAGETLPAKGLFLQKVYY